MAVATAPRGTRQATGESGSTEALPAPATLRTPAAAEALVLEVIGAHAAGALRVAHRHSLCPDDAHDAYQRSLELLLGHARRLQADAAHRWLFTVVKHEAQAIACSRRELLGAGELEADRLTAHAEPGPEERVLELEGVARRFEALRVLKPRELRALRLQAQGCSYADIQRATGWSYTTVNRLLSEGRRRFRRRCAELEAGLDCARRGELLAALAPGPHPPEALAELAGHLRRCGACRATLRAHRGGADPAAGGLLPRPLALVA